MKNEKILIDKKCQYLSDILLAPYLKEVIFELR